MTVSIKGKDETERLANVVLNVANRVGLLKHRLKIVSGLLEVIDTFSIIKTLSGVVCCN